MHKDCVGRCSHSSFLGFQSIFLFEHYYVRKNMGITKKILFSYYDYRNGSAEVYTAAGCSASNTALVAVYNVILMVAKSSTVLFGFAVYIAMFLLTLILKKKSANKRKPCNSYIVEKLFCFIRVHIDNQAKCKLKRLLTQMTRRN